jgi:hypothetical protein
MPQTDIFNIPKDIIGRVGMMKPLKQQTLCVQRADISFLLSAIGKQTFAQSVPNAGMNFNLISMVVNEL